MEESIESHVVVIEKLTKEQDRNLQHIRNLEVRVGQLVQRNAELIRFLNELHKQLQEFQWRGGVS